jgi:hypothetical protein
VVSASVRRRARTEDTEVTEEGKGGGDGANS